MDELVKRVATRLKVHNISGGVVHHVALFKRILDRQGVPANIIKGFCIIPETKEACEHYWVRTEAGLDCDIGFEMARLKNMELRALHPILLESIPQDLELTRSDIQETRILAENQRLFELHQSDSKSFWREAPRDVCTFHYQVPRGS